jgi:hypothetical protein
MYLEMMTLFQKRNNHQLKRKKKELKLDHLKNLKKFFPSISMFKK